tara:strand:+ start:1342 stop:1854 length:513 start_codon:yes stop_codon:yes gene_type:complete
MKLLEPWPHLVIDDFFHEGHYEMLVEEHMDAFNSVSNKGRIDNNDINMATLYKERLDDLYYNVFSQTIEPNYIHEECLVLGTNYEDGIHTDVKEKLMSVVVYLHTESADKGALGTLIYDKNKNFVKEIEWKPNRCLVFCKQPNVTWHNFKASDVSPRMSYNIFYQKRDNV